MADIEVERLCDMRAGYKLHVMQSEVDGDIHVAMMPAKDKFSFKDVEFCASMSQSPHTYKALCELIKAMQKDTEERPQE